MPCDIKMFESQTSRRGTIAHEIETHAPSEWNSRNGGIELLPVEVAASFGTAMVKEVGRHSKVAETEVNKTTMDALLCESTLAMEVHKKRDGRTASHLPYCQLGDVPLVHISSHINSTTVLQGMNGALMTKYPASVSWELSPAAVHELGLQLDLFRKHRYSVFVAYRDDKNLKRVEVDLLHVDEGAARMVQYHLTQAVVQHGVVPVLMAVRQDHPFHARALEMTTCDLRGECKAATCAVPVDCACISKERGPLCRSEAVWTSGKRAHAEDTSDVVVARHPHAHNPLMSNGALDTTNVPRNARDHREPPPGQQRGG